MNKNIFWFIASIVIFADHAFNGFRPDLLYAEYNKQVAQELEKNKQTEDLQKDLQIINQEVQNTIRNLTQLLEIVHKKYIFIVVGSGAASLFGQLLDSKLQFNDHRCTVICPTLVFSGLLIIPMALLLIKVENLKRVMSEYKARKLIREQLDSMS